MDKMADSSGENKQDNKGRSSSIEFGSTEAGSDEHRGDPEVHMHEPVDWNYTYASEIKELLLSNLREVLQRAIKQIVKLGYSEDVVQKALSRKAIYIQEGDPVSNVVNDTLNVLEGKHVATSDIAFHNFQHMLYYTMVEMITALRQARPSLTFGDSMWSLLLYDMNVSLANTMEDFLNVLTIQESSSCTSQESLPTHKKCKSEAPTSGKLQNSPNKESPFASERVKPEEETASLPTVSGRPFETSEDVVKGGSSFKRRNKKKSAARRQTFLHTKKARKACEKGGLMLVKKIEPPSDIHNQQIKSVSSSASDTIPKPKSQPNPLHAHKIPDYCAGIPYDKSLGKYVPRDEKDEDILKLVPQVDLLEGELQSWTNWANRKIMQVTAKLMKLQPEIKILKKEKQEAEKDAISFQENALKKISEVDNATENTNRQIESTTSDELILEAENTLLSKELVADKLSFENSMKRHQQALEREQTALRKAESLERENAFRREDLEREKQKLSKLQQQLDKEKIILTRIEGGVGKERAEKEKLLAQAASITRARKQLAEHKKAEEDKLIKKTARELQKHVEAVAKLERRLEEVTLKSDAPKIAALHKGELTGNKKSSTSKTIVSDQAKSAAGSFSREEECVMCLFEERLVFFLPCAHQVLCAQCNKLHESKGMKDCPICRAPIQQRIRARFVDP